MLLFYLLFCAIFLLDDCQDLRQLNTHALIFVSLGQSQCLLLFIQLVVKIIELSAVIGLISSESTPDYEYVYRERERASVLVE